MNTQEARDLASQLANDEAEARSCEGMTLQARQECEDVWTLWHAELPVAAVAYIEVITNQHGNAIVRLSGPDEDTVIWTEPDQCYAV